MYTVSVRDHVMIAHSFRGELFGPAQRLHGATYVVELRLKGERLHESGVLVDIDKACTVLHEVLSAFSYRNLDELPELAGRNTTTEVMAREIFGRVAARAAQGALGAGSDALARLEVVVHESHVAYASYEGSLASAARS